MKHSLCRNVVASDLINTTTRIDLACWSGASAALLYHFLLITEQENKQNYCYTNVMAFTAEQAMLAEGRGASLFSA